MGRRRLLRGGEVWSLGCAFFLLSDTIPIESERAGLVFLGAGCHMAFSEGAEEKVLLGGNFQDGFGIRVQCGDFILFFCLAARTFGELSCSSSSPTHPILMVGVWRGER